MADGQHTLGVEQGVVARKGNMAHLLNGLTGGGHGLVRINGILLVEDQGPHGTASQCHDEGKQDGRQAGHVSDILLPLDQ